MARISLGCYTIRVTDNRTGQYLPLGEFSHDHDLITIFTQYLNDREADYVIDNKRQKLRRVRQCKRTIWSVNGIVETGEYGYTADLLNVGTRALSYQRIGTDAGNDAILLSGSLALSSQRGCHSAPEKIEHWDPHDFFERLRRIFRRV